MSEKQISFQVNWVNTQAIVINSELGICLFNGVSIFWYPWHF